MEEAIRYLGRGPLDIYAGGIIFIQRGSLVRMEGESRFQSFLIRGVSSFNVPLFQGVLISRCPNFRVSLYR